LLAQLGLKRASELDSPDGPPAALPWSESTGADAEAVEPGDLLSATRSTRSIEKQHRENRIASGALWVPAPRPKPTKGRKGMAGGRVGGASANAGPAAVATPPTEAPPAPAWSEVGEAPPWAVQGDVPEHVARILEEWDRAEADAAARASRSGGGPFDAGDDTDLADAAVAERIAAGEEVLPAQAAPRRVVELTDGEALQLANAVCLRLLSAMPRTRHELERKLLERDVPAAAAATVLDRYEGMGFIDDAAFAKAWVESRVRSKGFASGRLKQELRRKGVDEAHVASALEQIDGDEERVRAEDLALHRLGHRTLPPGDRYGTPDAAERDKILRRLLGFLARKGYASGVAMAAARRAMERHDAGERG